MNAFPRGAVDQAQTLRKVGGDQHAKADGFTVQIRFIVRRRLDRMAEGMAEIQDGADVAFAFVARHHGRLDGAGSADGMRQRLRIAARQADNMDFQPVEQQRIPDAAVLDDLRESGAQFPIRQCLQRIRVGHHRQWLIEGPDEVLAARMVDAGLAAHGGIDLRQQRGRNLHIAHAALVARGGEAGDVAHHPAAQGKHGGIPVQFRLDQSVEHPAGGLQCFVLFAVGQHALRDPAVAEGVPQLSQVQGRDRRIGHHQEVVAADLGIEKGGVAQQARPDRNRITRMPDIYLEGLHLPSIRSLARERPGCLHSVCSAQLTVNFFRHQLHPAAVRRHRNLCDFGIQRRSAQHQFPKLFLGIGTVQQGTMACVPGPLQLLIDRRLQIDHDPPFGQHTTVIPVDHRTAAGGEDDRRELRQPLDGLPLAEPKTRLAFLFEYERDVDTGLGLDIGIAVVKGQPEQAGQVPADGRLAGTHRTDEEDVAGCGHAA